VGIERMFETGGAIVLEFKFDERNFRRAVAQAGNEAVRKFAAEAQCTLDRLRATHAGKPVAEVKAALQHAWRRSFGKTLTDPELSSWADHLAHGTRIVVRPEQLGL
jgi:hypothetical protein